MYFHISRILKYNIERLKIEIYVIVHVLFTPNWPNYLSTTAATAPSNPCHKSVNLTTRGQKSQQTNFCPVRTFAPCYSMYVCMYVCVCVCLCVCVCVCNILIPPNNWHTEKPIESKVWLYRPIIPQRTSLTL